MIWPRTYIHICAAKRCYNSQMTHPCKGFFHFPRQLGMCRRWLENCKRYDIVPESVIRTKHLKVCADHFEDDCFADGRKLRLKDDINIVPTIFENYSDWLPEPKPCMDDSSLDVQASEQDTASSYQCVLDPTELLVNCDNNKVPYNSFEFKKEINHTEAISQTLWNLKSDTSFYPVHDICRLCMTRTFQNYVEIFSDSDEAKNIRKMCRIVMPKKIRMCDGLPHRICRNCIADLKSCFKIVKKFKKADFYLRDIIKYSMFIIDEEYKTSESDTDEDEYIRKPVPKSAKVIPIDEFNPIFDKSVKNIQNEDGRSESQDQHTPQIELKDGPSENDIQLVCSKVTISKASSKSQPFTFKKSSKDHVNNSSEERKNRILDFMKDPSRRGKEQNYCLDWIGDTAEVVTQKSNPETKVSAVNVSFKCVECSEIFSSFQCLKNHVLKTHHVEDSQGPSISDEHPTELLMPAKPKLLRCSQCISGVFLSKADLKKHKNKEHICVCTYCDKAFYSQAKLDKHITTKHDLRTDCSICGKILRCSEARQLHERTHNPDLSEVCWICGAVLKTKSGFTEHMKTHESQLLVCKDCGKVLKSEGALRCHKKLHNPQCKKHQCPSCPRVFLSKTNLRKHSFTHSAVKPFSCTVCGRGFIRKELFLRHERRRENDGVCPRPREERTIGCEDGKRKKKKVKEASASFECDVCGRKFIKSNSVKRHRKLHFFNGDPEIIRKMLDEPEIYKCSLCEKTLVSKIGLEYHTRKHHTGLVGPFVCEYCGNAYTTHVTLISHQRAHIGDKRFHCSHCDKSFIKRQSLQNHETSHSTERPFRCNICDKTFKWQHTLKKHIKDHDKVKFSKNIKRVRIVKKPKETEEGQINVNKKRKSVKTVKMIQEEDHEEENVETMVVEYEVENVLEYLTIFDDESGKEYDLSHLIPS